MNEKFSDIVVLCSTKNKNIEEFQIQMIDSFIENTPEECKLLILENNSDCYNTKNWKDYVISKKQNFHYSDCDFNMNKLYNEGTKLTNKEFIMYANSDLIYFKDWYYNLLNWFDKINNLFVISPFTNALGRKTGYNSAYREDVQYRDEFIDSIYIPGWFFCMKRKNNFIWDENFKAHFQDNDFINIINKMRSEDKTIKTGFALNSRVDHLQGLTYKNSNVDYFHEEGRLNMIKKWGKFYL